MALFCCLDNDDEAHDVLHNTFLVFNLDNRRLIDFMTFNYGYFLQLTLHFFPASNSLF